MFSMKKSEVRPLELDRQNHAPSNSVTQNSNFHILKINLNVYSNTPRL